MFHAGDSCLHSYSCCFPKSPHLAIHGILPTDVACCLQKLVEMAEFLDLLLRSMKIQASLMGNEGWIEGNPHPLGKRTLKSTKQRLDCSYLFLLHNS